MEVICTRCDALGEERQKLHSFAEMAAMGPQAALAYGARNVAGWDLRYDLGYMRRRCEACNGEGFRPAGPSVPIVQKREVI
jgi:hypothetical protein